MMIAPLPADEARRIAALLGCGVLDTEPEATFDDVVQLASHLCAAPIALVSFVDRTRQWFKAKVGLPVSETPRDCAVCAHAILSPAPFVIPDVLEDPRFSDNPLVLGEPFIRFYAGVPLVLEDGAIVGTLCVIDRVPRELAREQLASRELLARRVSTELSLRRKLRAEHAVVSAGMAAAPTVYGASAASTIDRLGRLVDPLPVSHGTLLAGRYRVERTLGAGGMGVVAAAHDEQLGLSVAIKFMNASALAQPQAVERFAREARVLYALDVDSIARVLDVGNLPNGAPYIVMELLDGVDLATRLAREGKLPLREALLLMLDACEAVRLAHAHGILHRDLKPANLFVVRESDGGSRVKVLDFGISKLMAPESAAGETSLTGAQVTLGSPHYMAPEQMLDAAAVDERSDIWSLGVVLYELLSGRPPFAGASTAEVCAKVLAAPLTPLARIRADAPVGVAEIVERCLDRDRERRFASVDELARALRAQLAAL